MQQLRQQNKMVQLNCKNIEHLNHNAHTLLNYTNQFRTSLSEAFARLHEHTLLIYTNQFRTSLSEAFARLHEQYAFHKVSLLLSALETSVTSVMRTNELIFRNVVDASRGRVTSSLLPVKSLLHVLNLTQGNFSLLPIFTGRNVLHYYPLLSSMLISDAIVVHVPFRSHWAYNAYHIEPFPFKVNTNFKPPMVTC